MTLLGEFSLWLALLLSAWAAVLGFSGATSQIARSSVQSASRVP